MAEYSRNGTIKKIMEEPDYQGILLSFTDKDGKPAQMLFEAQDPKWIEEAHKLGIGAQCKINHENGIITSVGLPQQKGQFDPLRAKKARMEKLYLFVVETQGIDWCLGNAAEVEIILTSLEKNLSNYLDKVTL